MTRLVLTELRLQNQRKRKGYLRILPKSRTDQYDMMEIIKRLVDDSEMDMYKEDYGKSIITCYARPMVGQLVLLPIKETFLKQKKGENGGVIYSDSADKATRFIANCTKRKYPWSSFFKMLLIYG
jgi:acetyl-CoA carboxylase carboxyltransferase component